MTEKRKNLLFIAVILALAAVLWLAAHHGGTGRTAVLRYGDPQVCLLYTSDAADEL